MKADQRAGFTLLELLVALGVFSLAALALVNLTSEGVRTQARVETRTFGGILADNLAVEAMIAPGPLTLGESDGVIALAGRDWQWTREVAGTDDADLRRVTLKVSVAGEAAAERTVYRREM